MKAAARPKDARDLAKRLLGILDVLENIEDPDKIQLAVGEWQPLGSRQTKVDAFGKACRERDR